MKKPSEKNARVTIRFYEELNDYLPAENRKRDIRLSMERPLPVRELIVSLGIPPSEVDLILVNGQSAAFSRTVAGGDRIAVYPVFEALDISCAVRLRDRPLRRMRFFADVHLARLARYLRMLGFDTVWEPDCPDEEIIRRSLREKRIILSRDAGLLRSRSVLRGYRVDGTDPRKQIVEVVRRFDLGFLIAPFSRCMVCNGQVARTPKEELAQRLDSGIYSRFEEFFGCTGCGRIYWKGTHHRSMDRFIENIMVQARRETEARIMDEKTRRILSMFEQINTIPRCSKNEERISAWLQDWAEKHGFQKKLDQVGNLAIRVPASPGREGEPGVIVQGHMDMVCEKRPDSPHDFSRDPIRNVLEGDWLRAEGTTLGADNGVALAVGMCLATDPEISRPPLELLFTVDEESGLTGANGMDTGLVNGKVLLNLDTDTEGVFTVGCAGGMTIPMDLPVGFSEPEKERALYRITVGGLHGGHSGIDIHRQRANAIKVLARALYALRFLDMGIVSLRGGKAHNAIPRDAEAVVSCRPSDGPALQKAVAELARTVKAEYAAADPSLTLSVCAAEEPEAHGQKAVSAQDGAKIVQLLLCLPHGVSAMSKTMEGLVETSNNLGVAEIKDGALRVVTSPRSSVMSRLSAMGDLIEAAAGLAGAQTRVSSSFAPWEPDMESPLLKRCRTLYRELFQKDPTVLAIHAGLECAVIGSKYPGLDMISFGATTENLHSPEERLYVPSLSRLWKFLTLLLASPV
jgi:dipeptidase D